MVKSGHERSSIVRVDFANSLTPGFGFEAVDLAEVFQRVGKLHFAKPRRATFFQVMLLNSGTARQEIDFISYELKPGRLVFIRPGQVQRLSTSPRCQARLLLFEPAFLLGSGHSAEVRRIAPMIQSTPSINNTIVTLFREYREATLHRTLRRILIHELVVLLLQLQHQSELTPGNMNHTSDAVILFGRFEELLENSFAKDRSAAALARQLGCSEKTLSRACHAVAGRPPKTIIQQRVALEAKRILAHTNRSVKEIAHELGFSEPTNFVKFFRRLTGVLPVAFRDRAQAELAVGVRRS